MLSLQNLLSISVCRSYSVFFIEYCHILLIECLFYCVYGCSTTSLSHVMQVYMYVHMFSIVVIIRVCSCVIAV